MKVSYNWIKDYTKISATPEQMDQILTDTGLEVEGVTKVESVKGGLAGVVVGHVLTCEKHPDADKLRVTTVDVGQGEALQIVCGAPNVAAGQKVIVATVGTTLYPKPEEAFKIKLSKIRGVESAGMLCAEDELGLGQSHAGILVLPEDTPVGLPAAKYFDLEDDFEIEIGLTPNRADAMGHVGVVRDYIAYENVHHNAGLSLKWPAVESFDQAVNDKTISIEIEDKDLCPKYAGIVLTDVEVKASPSWMQNRLRTVGIQPINNIVDATNYVMRELGTPLHAFDYDKLNGKIVVKKATKDATFVTLDGVERKLGENNLMITNGTEDLCIAGVYGGLHSGVSEETTTIFIESAYFNPVSVRKTAREHGLNTDASFRFERGVDPSLTKYALQRVATLILEIAGGKQASSLVEIGEMPVSRTISYNIERGNRLIGVKMDTEQVKTILTNLDIKVVSENGADLELEVPAYRVDVTREADVVEEILRIYGFNNVPLPEKMNMSVNTSEKINPERVKAVTSEMLVGKGFNEILNNSLTKSDYIAKLGGDLLSTDHNVVLLNPLSRDLDVLRQTLLFNALEVVTHNQNRQNPDVRLFEFGKVYSKIEDKYLESKRLFVTVSGRRNAENWMDGNEKHSFFTIKGIANSIFQRLGLDGFVSYRGIENATLVDGLSIYLNGRTKVGEIGMVQQKVRKQLGVKQEVFTADLYWDAIMDALKMVKIIYKELPKTFAVRRDFSLLIDKQVNFTQIEEIATKVERKLLKEVGLFDVYEGDKLPEGKKSYAVSFIFQDAEKTLQDQQIDGIMAKIREGLEKQLGAELR